MLTFAAAVFLLIVTPGPGVLSTAGVGAAFGWRQGLFYVAGLCAGTNLVSLAVISGLAAVILADPWCEPYCCSPPQPILDIWRSALRWQGDHRLYPHRGARVHSRSHAAVHQPQGLCGEHGAVQQFRLLPGKFCRRDRAEDCHRQSHLGAASSCLAVRRGEDQQP